MVEAGYDAHAALRLLPDGGAAVNTAGRITGDATPFLANLEKWKPHAGLKPRPVDQAVSSIRQFDAACGKPIQRIAGADVQRWIESLINPDGESGLSAKTVNRKLAEIRNYWQWMQDHEIVALEHNPFANRRARDPAHRRKGKEDKRQRFRPGGCRVALDVCRAAWRRPAGSGDRNRSLQCRADRGRRPVTDDLHSRRSGDQDSLYEDGRQDGRWRSLHPGASENGRLIDQLIRDADADGYLIHSTAKNKYGERSQPIGKRFGRLKSELGFDARYVFHSLRKTVAHLLETAECPPGVAKDIIGHAKTDMTFGIYSGETRMDQRARWLNKAIRYPAITDVRHPTPA